MIPIRDHTPSGIFPFITIGIIAICTYALIQSFLAGNAIDVFYNTWGLVSSQLTSNPASWITVITSMFLHGGLLHFLSNMLFLWIFGDNVEADLGHIGYLIFYLLGGIIAALVQLVLLLEDNAVLVGASGAIAAVLGYYAVRFPKHTVTTIVPIIIIFTFIELPALAVLAFWFVVQLFSGINELSATSTGSNIAFFAHRGGFVYGMLVGLVKVIFVKTRR